MIIIVYIYFRCRLAGAKSWGCSDGRAYVPGPDRPHPRSYGTFVRVLVMGLVSLIFFAILYANLLIARAIRPRYQVFSPSEQVVERYRTMLEPYARWILPAIALVLSAFAAATRSG